MPVPFPHSVIYGLPVMKLDGLKAPPYDVADVDFSHDHGERKYPYVDDAAHRWTGLNPKGLSFTLHFLNTLEEDAFPKKFNLWMPKLLSGNVQGMVHPWLGVILVVVRGGSVKLSAQSISGVVVGVNFSTTILDPADKQDFEAVKPSVQDLAKAADAALEPFTDLTAKMPVPSFIDLLKQIQGLVVSLQLDALSLIAQAQSYVDVMVQLIDTTRADHLVLPARDALTSLWVGLQDLAESVGARFARKTESVTLANDTTLDAFAELHGNTLADVVGLNVEALAAPSVKKGQILKFYP